MKKTLQTKYLLFVIIILLFFSCVSKDPSGFQLSASRINESDIHNFQKHVDSEVAKLNYKTFENLLTKDFVFISKPTQNDIQRINRSKYLKGVKKVCTEAQRIEDKTKILNIFLNPDSQGAIYEFGQIGKTYYENYPKESFGIFEVHILRVKGALMIRKIILKADTGNLANWDSKG